MVIIILALAGTPKLSLKVFLSIFKSINLVSSTALVGISIIFSAGNFIVFLAYSVMAEVGEMQASVICRNNLLVIMNLA